MDRTGRKPTESYFAGYFDADGCVRFHGTIRVEIKSVHPWILEEHMKKFGGSIYEAHGERNLWRWCIGGSEAENYLITIKPFLYVKQAQADLCIQARHLPPGPERNAKIAECSAIKHCNYQVK